MKNVFIIGSKGIPAKYGGFETFVEELTKNQKSKEIKYHVSCLADNNNIFEYNGARCFNVKVPNIGSAKAVYYDLIALQQCINYIKMNQLNSSIIYILACRIGPFMWYFQYQLRNTNVKIYLNPDGHEWLRAKWSLPVRKYWKISERLMVKSADLVICDSKNIENYIQKTYKKYYPETTFIAYGASLEKSTLKDGDRKICEWFEKNELKPNEYYLVVGRFVPENNYETMIKEFMKSNTTKSFALITNVSDEFLKELKKKTKFHQDSRIKFVGTVYNQDLLKKIRENAYGYFHGHEVGGTNPSLLEALGSTKLNLLLNVGFNREVADDSALYWNKTSNSLARLIDQADLMDVKEIEKRGELSKERIKKWYSWAKIVKDYEEIFLL